MFASHAEGREYNLGCIVVPVRCGVIQLLTIDDASTLVAVVDPQYGGCDGTPRYGTRDGPLSFCQTHKRAGLYTTRDGELYVATRDGSGRSLALAACFNSSTTATLVACVLELSTVACVECGFFPRWYSSKVLYINHLFRTNTFARLYREETAWQWLAVTRLFYCHACGGIFMCCSLILQR